MVARVDHRIALAAALGLLAALASPAAATPRDELLRFVPDDVGFCLALQDMRSHAIALSESPFVAQVRDSALGTWLRGAKEIGQLDAIETKLKKHLDLDWAKLRDDLLGDALVFAYKQGAPGKPKEDQGLILVRARTAKVLAELVDRVNKVQRDSGELKELKELEYRGVTYFRREDHKDTGYYCLRGPVLLYSGQEDMLRLALDREAGPAPAGGGAVARAFRDFGAEKSLFALWVNPRALDSEVEAKAAETKEKDPAQAAGQKTVVSCWKALDGVVVAVNLDRDVSVSVGLRGRPEQLPAGVRRLLAESAKPSDLWRIFPDNAMLALALRVHAPALFDAVGDFLSADARKSLHTDLNRSLGAALCKDFVKDVLPAVGPDWGLCVVAPPAGDKGWFPRAVLAVRIAPSDEAAPVAEAVLAALHLGALSAVISYNREHPDRLLELRKTKLEDQKVHYLAGESALFPGLEPALMFRDGYLVLATSLEALRRFRPTGPVPDAAAGIPLVRLSLKDCRAYLRDRRDALAQALADKEGVSVEETGPRLDRLLAGLQFVDRVELRQKTAPGQVVFTLTVQPSQPFKK